MKEKIAELSKLIENFRVHLSEYKDPKYKEKRLRNDFLDPFFEILDWDVRNREGKSEDYRDVIVEDSLEMSGGVKAPDYCFKIGKERRFYVEAKKPSSDIKDNSESAYQVRRYGHTAGLPLCILTDFEEFAVYDTQVKPSKHDKAGVARIFYCNFEEYIKNFEFIYDTFSKPAIEKGSFDKYISDPRRKRGTESIDKGLLGLIEAFRTELAKNIALRNKELDIYQLNYAVTKTIDRIIFLRIAEDKEIESYGTLLNIVKNEGDFLKKIKLVFEKANGKYNSELFKPESFIDKLQIDEKILKDIITSLYYPDCPYELSVLPIEILGRIYEQFLGKIIRLTESHQAKIEEKPEVKKSGGVYYTPQYIVNYIVENTVGEKIKGLNPKEIAEIKICDPACGSGSFLISAYQHLLDSHLKYYSEARNIVKALKENNIWQTSKGYKLTIDEKKRILLNNIFGVDIDAQAVEVTKLSLLLKLMEGENRESAGELFKHSDLKLLPNLSNNIKCGNSLVESDFYNQRDLSLFENEDMRKVNAFDWENKEKGFGEIMDKGGFDCIIGNPPYVFTKYYDWGQETKNYITEKYLYDKNKINKSRANQSGKINLFAIFVLKSIELMKKNGKFGYIMPNNILRTTVYDIVRQNILEKTKIKKIVDLKSGVFEKATVSTIILILEKGISKENNVEIIDNEQNVRNISEVSSRIKQDSFLSNTSYAFNIFQDTKETKIFESMLKKAIKLGEIINVLNGIATFKEKEGIVEERKNEKCKKIIFGKDIKPYYHEWSGKYIVYEPKKLLRARDEDIFLAPEKLIMQRIGGILVTSFDDQKYYTFNSVNNLLPKTKKYSLKYILGILNSNLMKTYYIANFTNRSSLTVNISKTYLDQLPIREINFDNKYDVSIYEKLIDLVDKMIEIQKQFKGKMNEHNEDIYRNKIHILDRQINDAVYELYGLTKEEIKKVEDSFIENE